MACLPELESIDDPEVMAIRESMLRFMHDLGDLTVSRQALVSPWEQIAEDVVDFLERKEEQRRALEKRKALSAELAKLKKDLHGG